MHDLCQLFLALFIIFDFLHIFRLTILNEYTKIVLVDNKRLLIHKIRKAQDVCGQPLRTWQRPRESLPLPFPLSSTKSRSLFQRAPAKRS
ncbi:hypothetical protein KL86CLO1_13038 [uncultured Eubacteriales bacterium]|uniref:Uncharacterized protein n=1 Tax=uncultured Eubacteriales bacterium TaxID=172733 RepID=A0A212KGH8_9FIRM|nr:hypothetical protein KL86CLO1_13038 [uncultured Eubacteriales bacterium]